MKLVPDQSQRAAEKEILEGLGFTVIEMTPVPFSLRRTLGWHFVENIGG